MWKVIQAIPIIAYLHYKITISEKAVSDKQFKKFF